MCYNKVRDGQWPDQRHDPDAATDKHLTSPNDQETATGSGRTKAGGLPKARGKPHDATRPVEILPNVLAKQQGVTVLYEAGGWKSVGPPKRDEPTYNDAEPMPDWAGKKRPSMFMPRAFSRLTLELTDVRVERLQEISEADAIAEGLAPITKDGGRTTKYGIPDSDGMPGSDDYGWDWSQWCIDPRNAYFTLWDKINGDSAHLTNPFVWVLSFEVHNTNVDAYLAKNREAA